MSEDLPQRPPEQPDAEKHSDQVEGQQPGHIEVAYQGEDEAQAEGLAQSPEAVGETALDAVSESTNTSTGKDEKETSNSISTDSESDGTAPDESTRWDLQKAETLGAVLNGHKVRSLRNDGKPATFNDRAEEYNRQSAEIASDDRPSRGMRSTKEILNKALAVAQEYKDRDEEVPESVANAVSEAQTNYEESVTQANEFRTREIEGRKSSLDATAMAILSPYQHLYDLDPGTFARMPTEEFMAVAKEFDRLGSEIWGGTDCLSELEKASNLIKEGLEKGFLVDRGELEDLQRALSYGLPIKTEKQYIEEVRDRFEAARDYAFDKSDKQVMETFGALIEEFTEKAKAKLDDAEKKRQAIIDRYTPQDSPTSEAA